MHCDLVLLDYFAHNLWSDAHLPYNKYDRRCKDYSTLSWLTSLFGSSLILPVVFSTIAWKSFHRKTIRSSPVSNKRNDLETPFPCSAAATLSSARSRVDKYPLYEWTESTPCFPEPSETKVQSKNRNLERWHDEHSLRQTALWQPSCSRKRAKCYSRLCV